MPAATEVIEDEGVVVAIVSVTGTVDSVKDVIEPGAYAKTLAARRPKVVWSHDWDTPIGRVDEVKELLPGDPLLPKTQPNGEPWPADAGALVVKTLFNLETQRGREAFSDVKFYGQDGAWSIGYNVPVGGATVEAKTGIRRIKELELYEVSPVLHGAHSMAGTQFVKALDMPPAAAPGVDTPGASAPDAASDLVCELCAGVEPRPGTQICLRCDGPMVPTAADASAPAADAPAAAEQKSLTPEPLDRSPKHNWVEDSGGLPAYIQHIAKDLHEERGMTLSHAIAVAISRVKKWAAGGDNVKPDTRAKAAAALAEWEALKAKNAARTAAHRAAKSAHPSNAGALEHKWFRGVTGSVEETLDRIRSAVRESLTPQPDPAQMLVGGSAAAPYVWVDVIGTYDDYVLASVSRDGDDDDVYRVPYIVSADGEVILGVAVEVDLQTVVVPKMETGADIDIDDTMMPAMAAEKALRRYEVKAGRVLSTANAARLKAAVEELVHVLQAAGVDMNDSAGQAGSDALPAIAEKADGLSEHEIFEFEKIKLAI